MSGAPPASEQRRAPRGALILAGAVGLAYWNSLSGPFVFDDSKSIVGNASLLHLGTAWHPPGDLGVAGRPVLNFSLALNFALGGVKTAGYHAVNLLIHLLAALTLFGIVRRTLRSPVGQRFAIGQDPDRNALLIALLWAVHPVQTSSVTYVIQRAESLMGLFALLTLYCFVRYAGGPGSGSLPGFRSRFADRPRHASSVPLRQPSIRWDWLCVAAGLLGMGTKEVMVAAPVLVLLYDRTFLAGSFGAALRRRWPVYAGLAATWLVLWALIAGLPDRGTGYGYGVTAWSYALTETEVLVRYLGLALWPHPLVLDYNQPIVTELALVLPYSLIVAALLGVTLWALVRRPVVGFCGAWFWVSLAPTSSVVPVALQPMAENRLYLPLAGVIALAVAAGSTLFGRKVWIAGLAVAAVFIGLTLARNADYRSEIGIWQDTVRKSPDNPRAQYNLGTVLLKAGNFDAALPALERARELSPSDPEVVFNLALDLADLGRLGESAERYEEALRLRPRSAVTENNLGIVLARLHRTEAAIEHFAAAVAIDPHFADAEADWGNALYESGHAAEAAGHLAAAVRLRPEVARFHIRLAMASAQSGHPEIAVREFAAALRIDPNDAATRANLEMMRRATGR